MATINMDIINLAIEQGLITGPLSENQKATLKKSIVLAHQIYQLIKQSGEQGLNVDQIVDRLNVSEHTIRLLLRQFALKEIITVGNETDGKSKQVYYERI